ncbi:MAG: metallophosphoesterase [Caldilineales bacterium]|nr:metallophosphoesterase [Caldilineales bacterium]
MPLFDTKRRRRYRVLAVSDKVEPRIYGPNLRNIATNIDFILSCGDLPYYYLDYIIGVLDRPLYYVHGNHDRPEHRSDKTVVAEPPGGTNLHLHALNIDGLLIAGFEGSHRYNSNVDYQYTQNQMWLRVLTIMPTLLLNRATYGRGLDILVTHSPPFGIHDGEDRPHIGFRSFLTLMRWFRPRYMIHGHQHVYSSLTQTRTHYAETEIINIYPYQILEFDFSDSL